MHIIGDLDMSIPNLVFLLSAPYSGATLLSILLNQHPEISSDGEIFPYIRGSKEICSCEKDQISCDYYQTVANCMMKPDKKEYDDNIFYYVPRFSKINYLSRAFEGFWINPLPNRIRNMLCSIIPKYRKLEYNFTKKHIELVEKSLCLRNAHIYIDGTKSLRRAEFFAERKLTSIMIHLIRDGRAFCYSFLKNNRLPRSSLPIAARVWKKNIKKVDTLRARFPHVRILDVRYNDLCSIPGKELRRIFDFLQLSYDDSFLVYSRDDMHIIGNRMRFNYSGTIMEDFSWKKNLKQEDVLFLSRLMEHELKRFHFLSM